jgi:hypothetical protein
MSKQIFKIIIKSIKRENFYKSAYACVNDNKVYCVSNDILKIFITNNNFLQLYQDNYICKPCNFSIARTQNIIPDLLIQFVKMMCDNYIEFDVANIMAIATTIISTHASDYDKLFIYLHDTNHIDTSHMYTIIYSGLVTINIINYVENFLTDINYTKVLSGLIQKSFRWKNIDEMLTILNRVGNDISSININSVIKNYYCDRKFINLLIGKGLNIGVLTEHNSYGCAEFAKFIDNIDIEFISNISDIFMHERTYVYLLISTELPKLDILLSNSIMHITGTDLVSQSKTHEHKLRMSMLNNYEIDVCRVTDFIFCDYYDSI